ncbi:hypothetical protein CR513_36483, partial [Mucuna pruriens]
MGFPKPNLLRNFMRRLNYTWKERGKNMQNKSIREKRKRVFKKGDIVWVHSIKEKSKLLLRGDGHFKIIKRINDNSYKVGIPQEYGGSNNFNMVDLSPYDVGTQALNLRSNSLQEGKDDINMVGKGQNHHRSLKNIETTILEGPMTKEKLRKLQEEVHKGTNFGPNYGSLIGDLFGLLILLSKLIFLVVTTRFVTKRHRKIFRMGVATSVLIRNAGKPRMDKARLGTRYMGSEVGYASGAR